MGWKEHFQQLVCHPPVLKYRTIMYLVESNGTVEYTDYSLQRGKTTPNEFPEYDAKRFDGEVPAVLELWGMQSTPSLPSLQGLLRPGVVAPDRVISMGQIELNCIYAKRNCLK